jgi:HEAT repeat protein
VVARLKDEDQAVRDQAIRMLSCWPDPAATQHLLELAKNAASRRHHTLALRGLVRLARPQGDRPADLETFTELVKLATWPDEKCLVLGALGDVATSEALALVMPMLDDPKLADAAGLAAVRIAEKMEGGDQDALKSTMQTVLKQSKHPEVRRRAQAVVEAL